MEYTIFSLPLIISSLCTAIRWHREFKNKENELEFTGDLRVCSDHILSQAVVCNDQRISLLQHDIFVNTQNLSVNQNISS